MTRRHRTTAGLLDRTTVAGLLLSLGLLVVGVPSIAQNAPADEEERFETAYDPEAYDPKTYDSDELEALLELELEAPAWRPVQLEGAAASLDLVEALRLTLANDPAIRLEEQNAAFRQGILQEELGVFDAGLAADASYEYVQNELRARVRQQEVELREKIADGIVEIEEELGVAEVVLDELQRVQDDPRGFTVSDPDIQIQIDILNAEIDEAEADADEATRQRYLDLRDRTIANEVENQTELVDSLRMDLDTDRTDLANLGPAPTEEENSFARLNVRWEKLFRPGFTIAPFYEFVAESDNFVDKPTDVDFGGKGIDDTYRSRLGFTFDTPLLRGFGREATTAFERVAALELEATLAALRHRASLSVLQTLLAYWDARAAQQRIDVLGESVELQEEIGTSTRSLIEADELPAVEIARVDAQVASINARLESARQAAIEARLRLAEVVGLEVVSESSAPVVTTPLPDGEDLAALERIESVRLVDASFDRREDLAAAGLSTSAGAVLARRAELDLPPRLDLDAGLNYNSLSEDDVGGSFDGKWVGPSYNIGLAFDWPFANNVQEGRYAQAVADREIRAIQERDLRRQVANNIAEALASLAEAREQLRYASEAVDAYARSLGAERELFGYGETTLIDTLLTEQRWTEAKLAVVEARAQIARQLAILRFETGVLFTGRGVDQTLAADELSRLPAVPGRS